MWIGKTYLIESSLEIIDETKKDFSNFNQENIIKVVEKKDI
jgi:hypothetical protein